ncbi:GIY-YIG nuclease family protein [Alicyclobacillus dauci]|uniref:GIY-YIG nuclease family protein n=1 Tax=Alicyclobacillus dauci TaxID=1475485 RepID=A0ABY6Z2Y2_9BACL|nr:GIY-YIG nuclease family protein [Alicyclobacillus dauci]WAH36973.1 GIY-YIG nuclease family protein [Alicyclobacillus dauci]
MIYFIQQAETGYIKIGYTKNIERRLKQLQADSPSELVVLATFDATQSHELRIHKNFGHCRVNGEWYNDCPEIRALMKSEYALLLMGKESDMPEIDMFIDSAIFQLEKRRKIKMGRRVKKDSWWEKTTAQSIRKYLERVFAKGGYEFTEEGSCLLDKAIQRIVNTP